MKEEIIRSIQTFVATSPQNRLAIAEIPFFGEPLVRVASAEDKLFYEYKDIIGPEHLTPREVFEREFGKDTFNGGSVLSVVLPISEPIRKSNRPQRDFASKEWALLRAFGDEVFMHSLGVFIASVFEQKGYRAFSPSHSVHFSISRAANGPASNWSERHIAYVAGHGAFSLNDGFITERGTAIRLVSVVTNAVLAPDIRSVQHHNEYCLFCSKGKCGACIKRCPVGAITKDGHDKIKCYQFVYGEESRQRAVAFGGNYKTGSGCGLCQTKVPCEYAIP
ncbi:MAG: (Fe-S)-binding protein [Bacteroidota bacterium]|nr:(Fe-S)-binding protein [Bacteroidota bacterium]